MQDEFIHTITNTLDLLTDTYNYNHWIYSLMRPHLGERILEVGAGIGNITQFLLSSKEVVCLDLEDEYVDILRDYAHTHKNITPLQLSLLDLPSTQAPLNYFDTVLCINVLEHIENDLLAVQQMASVLKPGGKLWLYVPAGQWAYGALDKELGHFRRYTRPRLRSLAIDANLELLECHYVNMVGIFGWYWSARVRKDRVIRRANAHLMDRLVPYLSAIERLVRPPFGQSLVAVMERSENLSDFPLG
ncbi:MAG: class I SAM-dependent methyltransferase [Anaerolineae bacterium]|nr:class I SAM-dependent methyltransferase [Anaerolineae bacterium]MBL6965480.1 class I SAM-dependent methyltransferase [Anaerolineales bacterium]